MDPEVVHGVRGSSTQGPAHIAFYLRCEAAAACRPLAGRNPDSILLTLSYS